MEEMITIPRSVYESERKMRFFGGTADDVYKKRHNIFIGVSISNKKITPEMAHNYLVWAKRNTKGHVAVIIADELNVVNYKLLDGYSSGKAENRAKSVGDRFEQLFKDEIEKLPEKDNVHIYRWSTVKSSPHFEGLRAYLADAYANDDEFKSACRYFIKKYMRKKGKVLTEEEKIDQLATYIISELPTLLQGIFLDGIHYDLCIYPTYFASRMSQFVMDMHEKELEVGKHLELQSKAILVEAWLD